MNYFGQFPDDPAMTMNMDGWTQDISYTDYSFPTRMGMSGAVTEWWNQLTGIQKFLIVTLGVGVSAMLIYYRDESDTMKGRKKGNPYSSKGYKKPRITMLSWKKNIYTKETVVPVKATNITENEIYSKIIPLIKDAFEAELLLSENGGHLIITNKSGKYMTEVELMYRHVSDQICSDIINAVKESHGVKSISDTKKKNPIKFHSMYEMTESLRARRKIVPHDKEARTFYTLMKNYEKEIKKYSDSKNLKKLQLLLSKLEKARQTEVQKYDEMFEETMTPFPTAAYLRDIILSYIVLIEQKPSTKRKVGESEVNYLARLYSENKNEFNHEIYMNQDYVDYADEMIEKNYPELNEQEKIDLSIEWWKKVPVKEKLALMGFNKNEIKKILGIIKSV